MMEVGPGSENNPSAAEPQARHDFSVVQGFQVVGAEDPGAARAVRDQAWRDALRLELEVRAARFHQAVDAAIVLSNDGIIRWLGDPVARLAVGPDVLNPSAVIFADEGLPAASRDTVKTRIELWIAATTRRVLAPLFALEAIQEGPEIVRDLAHKLAPSLGIMEREPIRAQLKALSQNDRAELRKQGVRFGAYYLFVPALIKPGPRTLAVQLWSLRASGDANELLRALGPVASSGRTSLSLDSGISQEGYRVAGYRPCGERIVRVDIIERLAGMIRATAAGEPAAVAPGGPSRPSWKGFVVSGQMTSLTGCSGEQFASILRSMGLRPVEMKRSEFFGSQSSSEAARPGDDRRSTGNEETSPPTAGEDGAVADPVSAAPPAEPVSDAVLEGADAVPEDADALLQGVDVVAESADLLEGADALARRADAVAEGADPVPADTPMSCAADPSDAAPGVDADAQSVSSQISGSGREPAKSDDLIVVWRPDRSRIARNRGPSESKQSGSGNWSRLDADGRSPAPGPKRARNAGPRRPPKPNRPDPALADEKRRQRASEYDMPRLNATTAPQHKAKVDPNSPFAKLLELRSLLEEQANKRS
jgi:ATP-dependent RNA helicase SUPV3L1/SUV3